MGRTAFVVLALAASACTSASRRAPADDPPSGVTDPGHTRLASASGPDFQNQQSAQPTYAPESSDNLVGPLPSVPGLNGGGVGAVMGARGAEPTASGGEMMKMTREHCETLGRKFASLTMAQGGSDARLHEEAERLGRDFASKCTRDMAGQSVRRAEYDCMLHAQAAMELLSCGK